MAAYNRVNGVWMTENAALQHGVLKGEWHFDGLIVSDWLATRDTVGAADGGLDIAMPALGSTWGAKLVAVVRDGSVAMEVIDDHVRRLLRLAARVGALEGAPESVPPASRPGPIDGPGLARQIAARSFVLAANPAGRRPLEASPTSRTRLFRPLSKKARAAGRAR